MTTTKNYVQLPAAPKTASPVPSLTSIHASKSRGPYGSARYRGNCGGYLIADLIDFFGSRHALDPMTGSGTCRDVCKEKSVPCTSFDIRSGHDAANPDSYKNIGLFDMVWLHPPYWKMIKYNEDPRCLSNAGTLDDFLAGMDSVLSLCLKQLTPRGKIAVLIGGFSERGRYQPLSQLMTARAASIGLWPATTEIIRFQHGNTSSRRTYQSSFIPGIHDVCTVYERL